MSASHPILSASGGRQPTEAGSSGRRPACRTQIAGRFIVAALCLSFIPLPTLADDPRPAVIVVVGKEGAEEFGKQFRQWAARWEAAATQAHADYTVIGLDDSPSQPDRERLKERLAELTTPSPEALWLVLIGHGTFDGKTAKFNFRGDDVTPAELGSWLKPVERPLAVINCTSCSGPFLNELSGPDRVIITATRSGSEFNFARLGDYLSSAIADLQADLDKDDQTSLLEAFLRAAAGVREFYASEGRLATEHALIDDNGDKLGTPADWFTGLRPTKAAKDGASLDGLLAGQFVLVKSSREEKLPAAVRARRDELERDLAALRQRKSALSEEEYLSLLEPLLVELARLYEAAEEEQNTQALPRR